MSHRINSLFRVPVAYRHRLCVIVFLVLVFSALGSAEDFTIQTFAGGGLPENIPGTSAVLHGPGAIVTDANGNAFFGASPYIILKLDPNGLLTRVAGTETPG